MIKIRRTLVVLLVIFALFFSTKKFINNTWAETQVGDEQSFLDLAEEGQSIICLKSTPDEGYNTNHISSNTVKIKLTGNCGGTPGCYLITCQGINEQRIEDEQRAAACNNGTAVPPTGMTFAAWCAQVYDDLEKNSRITEQGCSSGKTDVDIELFGADMTSAVPAARIDNPSPIGKYPIKKGEIETIITLNGAYDHIPYQFYAIGPGGAAADLGAGGVEGENRTIQVGEINTFKSGDEGNISKCVTITWDPYGRVFDAQSLEPIPLVKVTLLNNEKKPASQFLKNFDVTSSNGVFNIQVEKTGNYFLTVDPPASHGFVSSPNINPNYKYIYSDLYYPDVSFEEKAGIPTHHDIPLYPKGDPYKGEVVIYEKTLNQIDMGDYIKLEGKISHPLARVCLTGETSGKQYGCSQADKVGFFMIGLSKKEYPQEALYLVISKVDPNNLSQFTQQSIKIESLLTPVPENQPPNKKPVFEPLLRYVEGYISPQAKVTVKLKMNKAKFYETKADDSGFIKILSKNLPLFDYYFEVLPSQSSKPVIMTTSDFVDNNKDLIKSEKLNLITGLKNGQSVANPSKLSPDQQKANGGVSNKISGNKLSTPFNKNIIIIGLILILLITVTVGMILYIKKIGNKKL